MKACLPWDGSEPRRCRSVARPPAELGLQGAPWRKALGCWLKGHNKRRILTHRLSNARVGGEGPGTRQRPHHVTIRVRLKSGWCGLANSNSREAWEQPCSWDRGYMVASMSFCPRDRGSGHGAGIEAK